MCGRFENRIDPRKLALRYGLKLPAVDPNYYIPPEFAPTMLAPVLIFDEMEGFQIRSMKWGLIPGWSKDPKIGLKCFNARAETAAEKPAFRDSWRAGRRCLIPATAFFEWRLEEEPLRLETHERAERRQMGLLAEPIPTRKVKKKYRFTVPGEPVFSLAGLWAAWLSPQKERVETFTILTTQANELLSEYHDRMPVILDRHSEQAWLNPRSQKTGFPEDPFAPFPAPRMRVEGASAEISG